MRAKTRRTLRLVTLVTALSASFGFAMSFLTGGQIPAGILAGVLIALAISALEILLLQGRWVKKVRRWCVPRGLSATQRCCCRLVLLCDQRHHHARPAARSPRSRLLADWPLPPVTGRGAHRAVHGHLRFNARRRT